MPLACKTLCSGIFLLPIDFYFCLGPASLSGDPSTKEFSFHSLPHMPSLGSSNSAANKDMMVKIRTNRDTIICLSRKRNCSLRTNSLFPTMFSKAVCCLGVKTSVYGVNIWCMS